jgi:hypothetical protein
MIRRYVAAFCSSFVVHALVAVMAAWPISPGPPLASVKPARAITTFIVAPPEDATFPGLNPVDRSRTLFARDDRMSGLQIGNLRIDVDKIGSRAQVLFPFLTPGLSLDRFLVTQQDVRVHLQNPLAGARGRLERRTNGPLVLDAAALQSLVDKSWGRRDRWTAFEPLSRLAETHDPDAGRLPVLLQRYTEQNSLQPYADQTTRDPRLWAQLGLAADHVNFIGFIRRYAAAHPSTRTTTALLFLLDRVAEANLDALGVLLDSDPAEDLNWTRNTSPKAYYLITELRRHYRTELVRRGLTSAPHITAYYEKTRLAILNGIVRTTPQGYRANDARFLIGAIYWRQQQTDEALRTWSEMTVHESDGHAMVNSELVAALRRRSIGDSAAGGAAGDPALRREIDQILKNDHGRWVMFSYDRLRHFGYRFDSF